MAALMLAVVVIPAVGADHIRAMTARQSGSNGNEVTVSFDFNPSGNCCGGYINFNIGDSAGHTGSFTDGVSNGVYQGDAGPVTQNFYGVPTKDYTWNRYKVQDMPLLVRIDVTWEYDASGPYVVTWNDCCPASDSSLIVFAGAPVDSRKILALEVGTNSDTGALETAGFFDCNDPSAGVVCYDVVTPSALATMPLSVMDNYGVLYVAGEASISALGTLATAAPVIKDYVDGGGGVVVYTQKGSAGGYSWLPDATTMTSSSSAIDDLHLSVRGQAHMSYMNQFDPTISDWQFSATATLANWPAYLDGDTNIPGIGSVTGPLVVRTGTTDAISLAGAYGNGCVFATGQPLDEQAYTDLLTNQASNAAQQLVRTTIEYGLDCFELASSQILQ